MKKLSVVVFLSVASFVGVAYTTPQNGGVAHAKAQTPQDGNRLLKACGQMIRGIEGEKQDSEQLMEAAYCFGYIAGFLDAYAWGIEIREVQPLYCLPDDGIEEGQAARIIVKWMTDHPDKLHLYDAEIMLRALRDAFPCKNEAPSP